MTALPCRLQNDSPPESIVERHLNKENDSPSIPNLIDDSMRRLNENKNLSKTPKLSSNLEITIDESNYVNFNDITKCTRSGEIISNGISKIGFNGLDKTNGKLNNFYIQINAPSTPTSLQSPQPPPLTLSTSPPLSTIINGYGNSTVKPILSTINQKNLNNLTNGNNAKSNQTNNIGNNIVMNHTNHIGGGSGDIGCNLATNSIHLNINTNINTIHPNSNYNSALNDYTIDTKSITTNRIDYNQNGLPVATTAALNKQPYDIYGGHQVLATNKSNTPNNVSSQAYVIHNGNGSLTNGNGGIKEMPRADNNSKGKYSSYFAFIFNCFASVAMMIQ